MEHKKAMAAIFCVSVVLLLILLLLYFGYGERWKFVSYGVSTDVKETSHTGNFKSGRVTIDNTGSGKMVTYGADGLSFYYTKLDAKRDNFLLSAQVTVDSWTMSNGEDDGFGLMVSDSAGKNGTKEDFWNNSYMAVVTKIEYDWNSKTGKASNVGDHIIMRQGIGAREKIGSVEAHPKNSYQAAHAQKVKTCTLEDSQGKNGPGTYNIIGNYTPVTSVGGGEHPPLGTVAEEDLLTTLHLEIERDNSGYWLRYIEENGTVHEKLFYDKERKNLAVIDPKQICVGFFVARQARVTFHDFKLTVTDASKDLATIDPVPETIDPDFRVTSSRTANSREYELTFKTNYGGILSLKDEQGNMLIQNVKVKAKENFSYFCRLQEGENHYEIVFQPQEGGEEGFVLSDMNEVVIQHKVSYQRIGDGAGNIFVSPNAVSQTETKTNTGSELEEEDKTNKRERKVPYQTDRKEEPMHVGTEENPVSLDEAVRYAAPGQKILVKEGEYQLSEPLVIEEGHNGSNDMPITLMSDPGNNNKPVLNFQNKCAGLTLSADYWVINGLACTGSATNTYGIHLTGSHNRLENLEVYRNGNTGVHISSRSLWDNKSEWPSENYIINCSSYGNCDDAGEDADGFACQFTAGPGNVFEGCRAYHNADDGWDLFAKVWLEPLGPVTLRNCTAYRNGYLENGREIGNGNGFKLGGDGVPGGHIVQNCIAYENRNDGFTSNSCPNITLIKCTAKDNGRKNLSLYTKNQINTEYYVNGFKSIRTNKTIGESDTIEVRGSQKQRNIYSKDNYYWDSEKKASINSRREILQ